MTKGKKDAEVGRLVQELAGGRHGLMIGRSAWSGRYWVGTARFEASTGHGDTLLDALRETKAMIEANDDAD